MSREALAGIRVVDLSRIMAGPYCTMLLGDMGADVIKIEQPGRGDDTRAWGPPFVQGESAYYLSINRNKRSVTLDLKSDAGRAVLWRLIDSADVLVENFSPGTATRLGFGFEDVRERRPAIVYCSISGFGQEGPGRDRTAYDQILQGVSGLMSVTGPADGDPFRFGVPIADIAAGMFSAYAIVAALFHRERTGEGQYIDSSLLGGQMALLTYQAGIFFTTNEAPKRTGNAHAIVAPYQLFRTADGYVNITAGNDRLFARLCTALGLPHLIDDPRFRDNASRISNLPALVAEIEGVLTTYDTRTIMEMLEHAAVPCGPINTVPEAFADPQVAYYNLHQHVPHPTLGQHTDEVLGELGFTTEQIAEWRQQGSV